MRIHISSRAQTIGLLLIPIALFGAALLRGASATDTFLGAILGASLTLFVQRETGSRLRRSKVHDDIIQQVLGPSYAEVHVLNGDVGRFLGLAERHTLSTPFLNGVGSNWLYYQFEDDDSLRTQIVEYRELVKRTESALSEPLTEADDIVRKAAATFFEISESPSALMIWISVIPNNFSALMPVGLLVNHDPLEGVVKGSFVVQPSEKPIQVTLKMDIPEQRARYQEFWNLTLDKANSSQQIQQFRKLLTDTFASGVQLEKKIYDKIELLKET